MNPAQNQTSLSFLDSVDPSNPRPNDGRVKNSDDKSSWQVTDCWELHHEIVRRIFLGQKNKFIAQQLGCHPQTVSYVRNSEVVRKQLAEMQKAAYGNVVDLHKEIGERAIEALNVVQELMHTSKQDAVRLSCAKDVLDRAGYAPVKQVSVQGTVTHLTGEEIENIKELARQAQKAAAESGVLTLSLDEEGKYGAGSDSE